MKEFMMSGKKNRIDKCLLDYYMVFKNPIIKWPSQQSKLGLLNKVIVKNHQSDPYFKCHYPISGQCVGPF